MLNEISQTQKENTLVSLVYNMQAKKSALCSQAGEQWLAGPDQSREDRTGILCSGVQGYDQKGDLASSVLQNSMIPVVENN